MEDQVWATMNWTFMSNLSKYYTRLTPLTVKKVNGKTTHEIPHLEGGGGGGCFGEGKNFNNRLYREMQQSPLNLDRAGEQHWRHMVNIYCA